MPYDSHDSFCISNPKQKIWHNMTFDHFCDMLANNHIIFHSGIIDKSGKEGIIPSKLLEDCATDSDISSLLALFKSTPNFGKIMRENHFIMSWSMGNDETETMWKYCDVSEAVLIGSTCESLIENIKNHQSVNIGEIKYFDCKTNYDKLTRIRQPFLYKKIEFLRMDEREVRAITRTSGSEFNTINFSNWKKVSPQNLLPVTIDTELIRDVYVLAENSEKLKKKVVLELEKSKITVIPNISKFKRKQIQYV